MDIDLYVSIYVNFMCVWGGYVCVCVCVPAHIASTLTPRATALNGRSFDSATVPAMSTHEGMTEVLCLYQ